MILPDLKQVFYYIHSWIITYCDDPLLTFLTQQKHLIVETKDQQHSTPTKYNVKRHDGGPIGHATFVYDVVLDQWIPINFVIDHVVRLDTVGQMYQLSQNKYQQNRYRHVVRAPVKSFFISGDQYSVETTDDFQFPAALTLEKSIALNKAKLKQLVT